MTRAIDLSTSTSIVSCQVAYADDRSHIAVVVFYMHVDRILPSNAKTPDVVVLGVKLPMEDEPLDQTLSRQYILL
jgi:hypothetical protein